MNLPACKKEMDKFSKGLLYQIVPNKSWSNVCYTYRISNRLAGSVYRIALNDQLPEELKEWLKTIEFAHIKLQHYAKHQSLDFKFSAPKIRAVYEKLKPLFDDPVQDVDNMYDIFEDYIFKMLRDWECLTKYFTEDEVRYLDTLYPEECIIDGKPVYHMLPQDVGYPPGLTANEYLLLILQNPEEWFMNQAQAQAQANQRNRQQNNGTQGGCNTNQDGSSSGGQPDEADMNHNKEEKDKPQRKQKNNQQNQNGQNGQNGQSGQQNQQQNNQQQNGSQNGQQNQQPQQGMGSDQQNQDAAANTQSQDWKDGKNQNENSGSQNQSGSSSNNKDGDTEDRDSQSAGASGGQSKSDDKSESGSDGVGGGSSDEEKGSEDKESSNGGSSSKDGNDSDDRDGDSSSSGGSSDRGDSAEDEQNSNAGGSEEDGEKSEDDGSTASNDASSEGSDEPSGSGEDLSGDGNESENGSDSESEAEGDNTDQLGEGGDGQDSGEGEDGEDGDGDVEEPYQPTKEELEEMIKNFVQKIVTDYQKMVETKAEQSAAQNQELQGYSKGGGGGQGTVLADGCSNWVDFEGLEKEIKELLINRSITTSKRDLLYNYNRGRGCGDVLTPRYREETRYEDVPMTVILDVSGSISEKNILGFCNIFKNVSRMVDKKCTIVLWDTGLRAIFDSKDEIKAVSGGGTDIGSGIRYVKDKMQPADVGNLFVVSDCEDTLEDWNVEDFDTAYLVCWSSMDVIQHYTGTKFNEFCGQFEKILVKNN
jgi:hypothetical protein